MFDLWQILQNGVPELPGAALFFIFFFGTFVSEDAACLLAGTAAANGQISFVLAVTACFLGIFVGDILIYATGRAAGKRIFDRKWVNRLIPGPSRDGAVYWLRTHGATAVFLSRFVSGLRLPTYFLAGTLKTDFSKFVLYFLAASAVWTPILVGSTAFSLTVLFPTNGLLGLVVTAVILRFVLKYRSGRSRRLLVGRVKRVSNWEFWPMPIVYPPVVVYVLWLGLRHRRLTAFTAANTAIPAGGFQGESKDEIYKGLLKSKSTVEFMLAHTVIRRGLPEDERVRTAREFIAENALQFPLVLKPDVGERGKGVKILDSSEELEAELLTVNSDMILQEFAPGDEVSVFYYRYPNERQGGIFSITEKHFPELTGDGISTLEELILRDRRAVCIANQYFRENRGALATIPDRGKKVRIINVGTHSRGAVFLEGDRLKTVALATRIDEISRSFEGFYFGRFDIRAVSLEDLKRGEGFKIVELNGVTSESTNIYDPRYSLLEAYRILFRQWRVAFEIGSMNCSRGALSTPVFELVRLVLSGRPAH